MRRVPSHQSRPSGSKGTEHLEVQVMQQGFGARSPGGGHPPDPGADHGGGGSTAAGLKVHGASRSFRDKNRVVKALDDVSLDVQTGEVVAIVGPSGCGKSTLLRIIAGLDQPTTGATFWEGQEVRTPPEALGIVFQRDCLLEWRSVLANVLLQGDLRGWGRDRLVGSAESLLRMVGLWDFRDAYPRQLSGGMRQRVALCRALVHDPGILLLDEPFSSVDAITREGLHVDVSRMCSDRQSAVVLITHDIGEACMLADRVLVMSPRPGRIVGQVTVELSQPRDISCRASEVFSTAVAEVRKLLEASGGYDVDRRRA